MMNPNISCVVCQGAVQPYLDYQTIGKGEFSLQRCQACGALTTVPMPTREFLHDYYQRYDSFGSRDNYYHDAARYQKTPEGRQLVADFDQLNQRYRFAEQGEVLDLGSGGGMFLDLLKRRGVSGRGIEVSAPAVAFAREQFGVEARVGDALDKLYDDAMFGSVFMWDLLEHLPDQHGIARRAHGYLKSGGYLVIETPDNRSLIAKLVKLLLWLGVTWPASWLFGFHHVVWHTPRSVTQLLEQHGFKVLSIEHGTTLPRRIFPWSVKFFLPRLALELLAGLTRFMGGQNKMIIVAQKI